MPIYEYVCRSCGHELEALQKMSDAPLVDCPACAQPELSKKVSAAGFRLSGGGWYETDFKSGNKKNLAGDKKPKESSAGSADKKTDKKASTNSSASSSGSTTKSTPASK